MCDCGNHCPLCNKNCGCENKNNVDAPIDKAYCYNHLRQYFQEQATIPDGWVAVRTIYNLLKDGKNRESIIKTIEAGFAEYEIEV